MVDKWLHTLPLAAMVPVVFGVTYLCAAAIYGAARGLAALGWGGAFGAVSPGLLSPLGTIFGLFVAFVSLQVWENERNAVGAVAHEASALRAALIAAADYPGEAETRLRSLVQAHIAVAVTQEWKAMGDHTARLGLTPRPLLDAVHVALALHPADAGQEIAQRELMSALENALEARRQRIIISQARVDPLKWACLFVQAACALAAIAVVHAGRRGAAGVAMAVFATGVATAVLLILAYDEPFTGAISVAPTPLLQVMPDSAQ